ncbi:MAG: hypothetical protein IJE04_01320 [Bacilli bacterium]|nr:hypothetical protein [Bacilli bacterium]
MEDKFTNEEIKKALEQADANINFEEVIIPNIININNKVLRKEFKNERNTRPN